MKNVSSVSQSVSTQSLPVRALVISISSVSQSVSTRSLPVRVLAVSVR